MIPICKRCWRQERFDFHVPNAIWDWVVPPSLQNRVVCLPCFDHMAFRAGVDYSGALSTLYFVGEAASFEFRTLRAVGKC